MRPSTTVTVTTLAICATVAEAKMVTEVKRDNATVTSQAPQLTKRENCWTYYGDDVYNTVNGKRFYSEEVGYVRLGDLINPPWDPVAEQWVPTLEKCSDRKKVRMLDEIEEGYAKGLHDRLCCDDCSSHGCENPPSGKYPANSDTKESCIVM